MTPSLLEHLTGAAQAAPLPPAPENIMAAVASLPEASQDEVLKGMGFSRPVAPVTQLVPEPEAPRAVTSPIPAVAQASAPKIEMTREEKLADPEYRASIGAPIPAEEKPKRGRPPKEKATGFAAELMLACASGGNGTDEYDLYVARAREAGLL